MITCNPSSVCRNFKDIENYEEAFNSPDMYEIHHRYETPTFRKDKRNVIFTADFLKKNGFYNNRKPSELIFLKRSEHRAMHAECRKNEEHIDSEITMLIELLKMLLKDR